MPRKVQYDDSFHVELRKRVQASRWASKKHPSGKTAHFPVGGGNRGTWQPPEMKVIKIEAKKEHEEHPWTTQKQSLRIAEDHLRKEATVYQDSSGRVRVLKPSVVPVKDIVFTERNPVDLERRARYFAEKFRRGEDVPPIYGHVLPDGRFQVVDGHARVAGAAMAGITSIPAVENGFLGDIGKKIQAGASKVAFKAKAGVARAKEFAKEHKLAERAKKAYKETKAISRGTGEFLTGLAAATAPTGGFAAPSATPEAEIRVTPSEIAAGKRWDREVLYDLVNKANSKNYRTKVIARAELQKYYPQVYAELDKHRYTEPSIWEG